MKKANKIQALVEEKRQIALEKYRKQQEEEKQRIAAEIHRQQQLKIQEEERLRQEKERIRQEEERKIRQEEERIRQEEERKKKEEEERRNYNFLNHKDKINNIDNVIKISNGQSPSAKNKKNQNTLSLKKKQINNNPTIVNPVALNNTVVVHPVISEISPEDDTHQAIDVNNGHNHLKNIEKSTNLHKELSNNDPIIEEKKAQKKEEKPTEKLTEGKMEIMSNEVTSNIDNDNINVDSSTMAAMANISINMEMPEPIIDLESIHQEVEEELRNEEKQLKPDTYEYILVNSNEKSLMEYNFNTLEKKIIQPTIPIQDLLFHDESSFDVFIQEINEILESSLLNINKFTQFIEKKLLTPYVEDKLNKYQIQDINPMSNKKLLNKLIPMVHNEVIKTKLNKILNNLDDMVKEQQINTNNSQKQLEKIKSTEKTIFVSKKISINSNDPQLKNYIIFINFQVKKLYNLDHPLVRKFPNNINNNNVESLQSLIITLTIEDWELLEKNDIILITYNQYQALDKLMDQYVSMFAMQDKSIEKLMAINYQLNELVDKMDIKSNWAQFIIDFNKISNFYQKYPLPVLKKK